MIKSFRHKGLENFYTTGSIKGIQSFHANRLARILWVLDNLKTLNDLSSPSYRLHKLKGDKKNLWSVTVQANWRITFEYNETTSDIYIVDYTDYH